MVTLVELKRYYEESLESVEGMRERLVQEFALEDEFQEFVYSIIRRAGEAKLLNAYSKRMSFSGGSKNLIAMLDLAAKEVAEAATASGVGSVQFYCGLWPDWRLNAREVRVGDGAVIYVNTGLLVMIRMAAQFVAASLQAITGSQEYGPDHEAPPVISEQIVGMLQKYRNGIDVRMQSPVMVMRGPREVFRRQLNYLAVAYVIAHELGHVLAPLEAGPETLSIPGILRAPSEKEEMASYLGELHRDEIAYRILTAPPLSQGQLAVVTPMAPIMVSGLQSGLWWMDRAAGSQDFGWSHPAPDIRMTAAFSTLAPQSQAAVYSVAKRFTDWLTEVLQIKRWMDQFGRSTTNESQVREG